MQGVNRHRFKLTVDAIRRSTVALSSFTLLLALVGCGRETTSADRYVEPDRLYEIVRAQVAANSNAEIIVEIDHSRLAGEAGSPMPPAKVVIWSNPSVDAALLKQNPMVALDLPFRALAFEDVETGSAKIVVNEYAYVAERYGLSLDDPIGELYDEQIADALSALPEEHIYLFESNLIGEDATVTLKSAYGIDETERRVMEVIRAQDDTVEFGLLDFKARSAKYGIELPELRLVLFGGPGPGGKVMRSAPTLGLDAFCQKMLIWEDDTGSVYVSFNDLVALAKRQDANLSIPLRFVNRRIQKTFRGALE